MEKEKLTCFIARSKSWLFDLEAELSLGSISNISSTARQSASLTVKKIIEKADIQYDYNFDDILNEFPRVKKLYLENS